MYEHSARYEDFWLATRAGLAESFREAKSIGFLSVEARLAICSVPRYSIENYFSALRVIDLFLRVTY